MAIQFARVGRVSRSSGKNACCKGSYNARNRITDQKTNVIYDFSSRGDNVHHEILLPDQVDSKFKNLSELMNAIEHIERKDNSQLLKEYVLALPDDSNISLDIKKEMLYEFIRQNEWVKEGLGVQVDIHSPHEDEMNWHAHLLVTTRRFTDDGQRLGKKARDLEPQVRGGRDNTYVKSKEATNLGKLWAIIQNDYFKKHGLENRVDAISLSPQEHVGAVRMRSIFNEAAKRNEERKEAEIEHLNNGKGVLEKVSKHISVFTKGDLTRAVKCIPNKEARKRLVEEALSSKEIIPLIANDGGRTKYYTTHSVRSEERKIMRLSSYVHNLDNVIFSGDKIKNIATDLISDAQHGLTNEQHKALSSMLLDKSGLRILRGRAGTGKSYVLGRVNSIASNSGINVIGLAPTHKAKLGLSSCGYERVDTVKGMLFKLANSRFDLPKNSLIVVDEAGMVGNDDFTELLRVSATRKCNIILAGDERQLASIGRGGMFEVFADKYGSSSILDIKRQDSDWGKSVAMAFSKGDVTAGLSVLDKENRIRWDKDAGSSMHELLHDWSVSGYGVRDRLILAVKNNDVAALNHGAREHFKLEGKLKGDEFLVAGNHFMRGDRVLITKTNKKLGLTNGDLAEISRASADKFTLRFRYNDNVNNDKYISFNPNEYAGFRHGYATTVFKAQGASIKDVFVYHDGFSTLQNSYVSLSRHVDELSLYVNKSSTGDMSILTRQLANDFENGSSLRYTSVQEHKDATEDKEIRANFGKFDQMLIGTYDFLQKNITKFTDKYIPSSEYYNYTEPKQKYESVEQVIDKTYEQVEELNKAPIEEQLVVGETNHAIHDTVNNNNNNTATATPNSNSSPKQADIANKVRQSAKSRFYANADRMRSQQRYQIQKEKWGDEYDQLKSEIKFKAEFIAKDLLGEPNNHLSNGRELRYGDHGKLAIRITGEKAGTWYDFSKGEGGDLFHLVQDTKKVDFKEAAEYLRSSVGMSQSSSIKPNLQLVYDHANKDSTKDYIQEKDAKISRANKLYDQSKPIGDKAIAHQYLKDHRAISSDITLDIRTTGIYDKDKKEYLPALIAFARDKGGNITGGQHILLDKATNAKADIDVPKKSFGVIAGSFVDLENRTSNNQAKSSITIIAEGLETGLSVKQALCEHSINNVRIKTLCSLGISNIKNYEPYQGQRIIIASDNDGNNSITDKTISDAASILKEKGAFVEIVKPETQGDFNDILRDKENGGSRAVAKSFDGAIDRHSANSLQKYFAVDNQSFTLSQDERKKIDYLSQFKINENKILNAYRTDPASGKDELDKVVKPISFVHENVKLNMHTIDSANIYGANINRKELVISLLGKSIEEMDEHIILLREKHYIRYSINDLMNERQKAKTPEKALDALKAHQDFLAKLHNNHAPDIHGKQLERDINIAHNNQESKSFDRLEKLTSRLTTTAMNQNNIISTVKHSSDSASALNTLTKKYQGYVMNTIHSTIKDIKEGHRMILGNKAFTCEEKFLSHMLKEHKQNEFFPRNNVQKIYNDLTKQNEISHDLHKGMSL